MSPDPNLKPRKRLAMRVHDLVRDNRQMASFREAVRQWTKSAHRRVICPLPDGPLQQNETLVLLSALHDRWVRGVEKIDPWPDRDLDKDDPRWTMDAKAGSPFHTLVHAHLDNLRDDDLEPLDRALESLERTEINGHQPLSGEWTPPMSKSEAARRITGRDDARWREVQSMFQSDWINTVGTNKYLFRIDRLDPSSRQKLQKSERM